MSETNNSIQLSITGMTCASCSSRVQKTLEKTQGVTFSMVNLASERADITYDSSQVSAVDLITAIEKTGYGAAVHEQFAFEEEAAIRKKESNQLKRSFIISAILTSPLVIAMIAGMAGFHALAFLHNPIVQLILATPVQFYIGFRFYRNAWHSLLSKSPGMDLLVAMGTTTAYLYSIWNGFLSGMANPHLYFEASAVIITLVILGKFLEMNAKGKTSEAIRALVQLRPKTARVSRNGIERDILIQEVQHGETIILRPGETLPVDGKIISGQSAIDESMITGESIPADRGPGDRVIGGTRNTNGSLVYEATAGGNDGLLSRIIATVEQAQSAKAPIQRLADYIAGIFVPSVLGIALITFLVWLLLGNPSQGLISAVAVLVIACPCALGLATPTAIMVGTGKAAENGILIRNGESLEIAHRITKVVFDKTGTITHGNPVVTDIVALKPEIAKETLHQWAASVESRSEHPLGLAVQKSWTGDLIPVEDFTNHPGKGVSARIDDGTLFIGTGKWLRESGNTETEPEEYTRLQSTGKTVLHIALSRTNGTLERIGLLALADTIKPESIEAVKMLRARGIEPILLTGDGKTVAESIAREAGINEVIAEVLPEDKADVIKNLLARGERVAMVGDGINDAPALALSDIGIAMGSGTDVALETADITLMNDDPRNVVVALNLSARTMRKIRQNLFWAFFYNLIGIPFAALGLLSPIIAGAAMSFSSVSVVTNSLSLRFFKPNHSGKK